MYMYDLRNFIAGFVWLGLERGERLIERAGKRGQREHLLSPNIHPHKKGEERNIGR